MLTDAEMRDLNRSREQAELSRCNIEVTLRTIDGIRCWSEEYLGMVGLTRTDVDVAVRVLQVEVNYENERVEYWQSRVDSFSRGKKIS